MKNLRLPRSLRAEGGLAPSVMARTSLALGLSTAALLPVSALAQEKAAAPAQAASGLPAQKVRATAIDPNPNAQPGVPYKAKTSGDTRHTRPLAETPQTISVITKSAIDDSGLTDLRQILGAQPGITLGTGETGNAFGDRYIIRGQEARSDVFVDGLRDPGMTTRESFAIEQLEISKGPNSSFAGRGTAGGAINAVTKQATLDYDFYRIAVGVGTDKHLRTTADLNKGFTDQFALRANVLFSKEDVPGRAPADRRRSGLALSGLWEATKDLTVVIDYYGLRASDNSDIGGYLLPAVGSARRLPARNVPVYVQNEDFLKSDVDTLTARVNYKIAPSMKLTNLTRYGQSDNRYLITGASGATGYNSNGTTYATGVIGTSGSQNGLGQSKQGWQDVTYVANQTNLSWDQPLFGKKNEFIFSAELTDHKVLNGNYVLAIGKPYNCRTGSAGATNNAYCINTPTGGVVQNVNSLIGRSVSKGAWDIDWHMKSAGLSAMDTIDLTSEWTVFSGLRMDLYHLRLGTRSATTGAVSRYSSSDTLINGHLGVSYKINPLGMVYASYASSSDVNGGESDVTNSAYGGPVITAQGTIAGADPELSQNYEIGTKWNLLNERLLLTAAYFRTNKSDVTEGAAGYGSTGTYNSGANRVRGVELEAVGYLTDRLSGQIGFVVMGSEVTKSYKPGDVGKRLSNFANRSAVVQLKYELTDDFAFGGTWKYESERYAGQPDTAANYNIRLPSYTTVDLFASYRFDKHWSARLNIGNVADKLYYVAGYQSGSFLYRGDGRSTRVTVNYEF